jgi:phosphoethanolamine N-methyltransferase
MSSEQLQEYDDDMVALLEAVWGEGYMSPGGPDEIKKIVDGVEFGGKTVLDIGCGTGGIAQFLVETFGPRQVVGIDVDPGLIETASLRARQAGLEEQLKFKCVEPGPLPFNEASFDVVFSKDAMIHIAEKETLFEDIFRVLAAGGIVSACDWMSSTDGPFSAEMEIYIELENLGFGIASPARYRKAMELAGFEDIELTDRNAWYKGVVTKEYEALSGPLHDQLVATVGQEFVDHSIEVWRALKVVVDRGELRPNHMRARKPSE